MRHCSASDSGAEAKHPPSCWRISEEKAADGLNDMVQGLYNLQICSRGSLSSNGLGQCLRGRVGRDVEEDIDYVVESQLRGNSALSLGFERYRGL